MASDWQGNGGYSLAMKAVYDRIRFAFGKRPGCDWVLGRIVDYARSPQTFADWEHRAIARHLAICPDCAREFIEIQEGFTALAEMLHPDRDVLLSIDYEALARRAAVESDDRPARGQRSLAWLGAHKRLAAMAACVLLLVAGPVLAHVAGVVRGCFDDAEDPIETGEQVALHRETLPVPEMPGDAVKPAEADASASAYKIDSDITDSLDAELARQAARAEVEAMLPHTEAEYEAWARREYPHIMWLYDVLMGKQGLTQAERGTSGDGSVPAFPPPPDSPAGRLVSFGMTDDGNPTITLPDADGNKVTLCAVSEKRGLPSVRASHNHASERDYGWLSPGFRESVAADETGLESSTPITLTIPSEPWDGVPANIPEWAQRLYAATPESERPTGWRALLIYSGEVFKFDFPETLDEPNCIPTADAMHWALPIGDGAYDKEPQSSRSRRRKCKKGFT